MTNLRIETVNSCFQEEAKMVILSGLEERFGTLDNTMNQDLNNILQTYLKVKNTFLIGLFQNKVICTGALIYENTRTGRIVRMSVLREYRRKGFARTILIELEKIAKLMGYTRIVLETTSTWDDAINFYKSSGYTEYNKVEEEIHFHKNVFK
jgi:ribosomal protein S18 acetylase RimI-like enzyme